MYASDPQRPKEHGACEDEEKEDVEEGEGDEVAAGLAGVCLGVLAEGDEAGERGDERANAADVDADEQVGVVFRELREQDRGGHVADDLAGKCAEK